MKELAILSITEVDERIKQVPSEILEERINLIYSLGYVYNPYSQEFYNPFINKGLKAIVTYNLNEERIVRLHNLLEKEYIEQNKGLKSYKVIENTIMGNFKLSLSFSFFESIFGILGLLFSILAIIFHLTDSPNLALGIMSIAFFMVNYYVAQNLRLYKYEGDSQLSLIWRKYHSIFRLVSLFQYPYFYFLIYLVLENYWLPLPIILFIVYLLRKFVKIKLIKSYWRFTGVNDIRNYAEKNGLL